MSEAVLNKARELGQALTKSSEYLDVKAKQKIMFNDGAALEMLKTFHDMQDAAQKKRARNIELSPEETRSLEKMELRMSTHPPISTFHESQTRYQDLINKVLEMVIKVQRDDQEEDLIKERIPDYQPESEPEPDVK